MHAARTGSELNNMLRFIDCAPIKISLWCVAWMGVFVALCMGILGSEKILKYSEKNGKYYAALFFPDVLEGLRADGSPRIICLGDSTYFYPSFGGGPAFRQARRLDSGIIGKRAQVAQTRPRRGHLEHGLQRSQHV